ncbi:MAG: hypothetical protein EXR71_19645 [Myxococcales bacterium]|nr:hypothetical protein [Myxococcales bacterium]
MRRALPAIDGVVRLAARGGGPFRESEAANRPASPYAASKRAAELFCYAAGLAEPRQPSGGQ